MAYTRILLALSLILTHGGLLPAHGSCFFALPVVENVGDELKVHCESRGMQYDVGSSFRIPAECMKCVCSTSGLSCCGYGSAAGVVMPPKGCKVKVRDCKNYFVQETDETKECTSGGSVMIG